MSSHEQFNRWWPMGHSVGSRTGRGPQLTRVVSVVDLELPGGGRGATTLTPGTGSQRTNSWGSGH
ncbi:hypothetical protein D7X55_00345 [Corallococcus sp. AB049A]|uniref:Uncharacterized protein n=1 Tax=Corallococcus interemptor TaxID=2316720 RepID=A0A3A8QWZ4_9BACT|nr:hypothetical protein D7X96_05620 [Corallococcus interemptor]RKI75226.1 hypothetical protein D7X55_00345 [Corallococcus sp. AB049A]